MLRPLVFLVCVWYGQAIARSPLVRAELVPGGGVHILPSLDSNSVAETEAQAGPRTAGKHLLVASRNAVGIHNDTKDHLIGCGDSKTAVKDSRKLCPDTSHFNNTLLVIHFNYAPSKDVVPFLLKRYSQCFGHIVVVAQELPADCPESKGISMLKCKHAHDYIHTQLCYAAALTANPGFQGYLIMNDDALFIPKRFMSYNRDRWWNLCGPHQDFTPGWAQYQTMTSPSPHSEYWDCNHSSCGWDGVNGLISWWNTKATDGMKKSYTAHMGGRAIIPSNCWQDFVYIPQPMVSFYLKLATEMPYLQLELFHTMVHLLWAAGGGQEEHIPTNERVFDLPWDHKNDPSFRRGGLATLQTNFAAAMIHPLKLSDPTMWEKVDGWLFDDAPKKLETKHVTPTTK